MGLRRGDAALILLPFALGCRRRSPASAPEMSGAALIGVVMLVLGQALAGFRGIALVASR